MVVPITDFGFVQQNVRRGVMDAIARAAERFSPPRVALKGGAALVDDKDRFVWVEVRADDDGIEVMRGIAREIVEGVEPLGLYCDRRQFRARIPLAEVNDATTVEHLEQVLAALDAHVNELWTVYEVSVIQRGTTRAETVPIGPPTD
jgi:hypothetical protein